MIWKHALRNALIPVVTVLAFSLPSLFSSAVLTETVYSLPGVGRLIHESVPNSDNYVALILTTVASFNFLGDGLRNALDPRRVIKM
ncbi:MAG: ABC transporter permease subunit [Myxococcota bacterium]